MGVQIWLSFNIVIVMIRQNVFEQIFWIRGFALNFLADAIRCDLDLRLVV